MSEIIEVNEQWVGEVRASRAEVGIITGPTLPCISGPTRR